MSDTVPAQSSPTPRRGSAADTRALAQVEKWLAVIREIKQERATN